MTYSEKLRLFADYLDEHPTVAAKCEGTWDYPSIYIVADDFDDFQSIISDLGGFEKSGYGGTLSATHEVRKVYLVTVSVSGVCEATPKLDENGEPVMRQVPATEAKEVPVLEYKCPDTWLTH